MTPSLANVAVHAVVKNNIDNPSSYASLRSATNERLDNVAIKLPNTDLIGRLA